VQVLMKMLSVTVVIVLLFPHAAIAADNSRKVLLENDIVLNVEKIGINRSLPHAYYDQAKSSIATIYPKSVYLAKRRFGKLGAVQYSIICYKENRKSREIRVSGVAVSGNTAWSFETTVPPGSFGDDLLLVLEAITGFPSVNP
jgi:hypothetical protein